MEEAHLSERRTDGAHLQHQPLQRRVASTAVRRQELARLLRQVDEDGPESNSANELRDTISHAMLTAFRIIGVAATAQVANNGSCRLSSQALEQLAEACDALTRAA